MPTPLYEKIVVDHLKVSPDFLNEQDKVIGQKLKFAAQEVRRDHGDIFAINQCLHLAASIVLNRSETVEEALNVIRRDRAFSNLDPTTVLVVATFYYLLQFEQKKPGNSAEEAKELARITERFKNINWLIGDKPMESLGISEGVPISEQS